MSVTAGVARIANMTSEAAWSSAASHRTAHCCLLSNQCRLMAASGGLHGTRKRHRTAGSRLSKCQKVSGSKLTSRSAAGKLFPLNSTDIGAVDAAASAKSPATVLMIAVGGPQDHSEDNVNWFGAGSTDRAIHRGRRRGTLTHIEGTKGMTSFFGRALVVSLLGDTSEVVFEVRYRSTTPCASFFY